MVCKTIPVFIYGEFISCEYYDSDDVFVEWGKY